MMRARRHQHLWPGEAATLLAEWCSCIRSKGQNGSIMVSLHLAEWIDIAPHLLLGWWEGATIGVTKGLSCASLVDYRLCETLGGTTPRLSFQMGEGLQVRWLMYHSAVSLVRAPRHRRIPIG
jgi:hypothetical protein